MPKVRVKPMCISAEGSRPFHSNQPMKRDSVPFRLVLALFQRHVYIMILILFRTWLRHLSYWAEAHLLFR